MKFLNSRGGGLWPLPRIALAAGMVTLPLAGCDTEGLLEVEDPEFATPGSLNTPEALPTVIAGALGDFQIAFSGDGDDSFLSVTAVITDEFNTSDTFPTRTATDQRSQFSAAQGNTSDPAYEFLQLARQSLNTAAEAVARLSDDGAGDPRIALLRSLQGYTYVALGEAFCSNIPFSATEAGVPAAPGDPLSTEQVFDSAVSIFNTALAVDPDYNLAQVGKARALLNLGQFQEAAAAVAGVPTSFVYFVEHSSNTTRQYNPIFALQDNGRYSVADNEGDNGLPFRSALDPRVPWEGPFPGFDATIPQYIDLRYTSFDSDVPIAGGIEARLIEAEAALNAGNIQLWLSILNDLRADVFALMAARFDNYPVIIAALQAEFPDGFGELEPLTDPGTAEGRLDLMYFERGFWLYTTGHRLGDLRRLVRVYGRDAEQVFPSGDFFKGGDFGVDVAFPIPFDEVNNPQFKAAACDVTQA